MGNRYQAAWHGFWLLLGCLLLLVQGACEDPGQRLISPLLPVSSGPWANFASRVSQPNIILINLDDADRESLEIDFLQTGATDLFPNLTRLGREGLRFSNFHCAVPICGPSRACLLTGQYAFKTGIRCNSPSSRLSRGVDGGYLPYRHGGPFGSTTALPYRDDDLAVWMQDAGYRTMMVGKYLHDDFIPQPGEDWNAVFPAGWDEFYPSMGGRYFNYFSGQNGVFQSANALDQSVYPVKYRTSKENVDVQRLVGKHLATSDRPFFLYYAPLAPHVEEPAERCVMEDQPDKGMVEPRYRGEWKDLEPPVAPDYDEADMSDKPLTMQQLPRLDRKGNDYDSDDRFRIRTEYRRRQLSLRSVDDLLGELYKTLEQGSAVGNTIVILTSDHGYQLGHQRHLGKAVPYNRSTNSPLYIWGPGYFEPQPQPRTELLSQVDLAPTLLEIAGSKVPPQVQGQSFLPLLNREFTGEAAQWRTGGILIEHWERIIDSSVTLNATFQSLRLHDSVYTEWSSGECEYYDLQEDPYQVANSHAQLPPETRQALREQLRELKTEMPQPLCFLEDPFSGNRAFFWKARLTGIAEYKQGVSEVRLVISDLANPSEIRFWNGQAWTAERTVLSAELASKDNIVTDWSYEFAPELSGEGRFKVVARAVGTDGQVGDGTANVDFSIDVKMPVTNIFEPLPGKSFKQSNGLLIKGETADTAGINAVRILIADRERNLFWNGEAWQPERISLKAKITNWQPQNATWNYEFRPPELEGKAQVIVTGVNGRAEHDQPPRAMWVEWNR